MKNHPQREELQRLISGLLDERLTPEEHARLESLLAADPQARLLYMQMIDQEIELPCLVAAYGQDEGPEAISVRRSFRQRSGVLSFLWRRWVFATACALGLVVVFAFVGSRVWFGTPASPSSPAQQVTSQVALGDSWSEDFESGSSTGWYGQLVTNNLPAGSKYGIGPVVKEYPGAAPSYNIHLPENWDRGFVALTPESALNITYRLGNRTHVNVFMHTISPEPGERKYGMFQLRTGGGFPGRSGRWQTASIPFANFIRKVSVEPGGEPTFVGGPPKAGEPMTTLSFSSAEPSGLVIDRVWITPTGSAREEIVPLRN